MNNQNYVVNSLELHLFFGRIMKEHALFLEAGFTPRDTAFIQGADQYKKEFETLLHNAIQLSNGVISPEILRSGELVTDFTLGAEKQTQELSGISIDQNLTIQEANLHSRSGSYLPPHLFQAVKSLNAGAIQLLDSFINFKTQILNYVLSCQMFTVNYPLLLEHILREAKLYRSYIASLESGEGIDKNARDVELFWDRIMMEHSLFIRGYLDPTEGELINTANQFAAEFSDLIQRAQVANNFVWESVTSETLADTKRLRDFKAAGTKGITECKIRSVILPLLADHVLREANHYIRLLEQIT